MAARHDRRPKRAGPGANGDDLGVRECDGQERDAWGLRGKDGAAMTTGPVGAAEPDDIGIEEAARLLETGVDQVKAMLDEGMLTPCEGTEDVRVSRAEVLAARNIGG
jgi:hypothetical protein